MQYQLLAVFSKLADPSAVPAELARRLPAGWELSEHQLATYEALRNPELDVVINTALTGDGKSLAAYLPSLVHPEHRAFGMYPTIELSRDQERQFTNYANAFGRTLAFEALWGAKLGAYVEAYPDFKRRGEALAVLFKGNDVLLTNPDIFNLVMNYRYDSGLFSSQELPYSLAINFQTFIFDEFHIFSMPQIIAALTAMVFFASYMGNSHERPGFLFSSATTHPALLKMIEQSGLRYTLIPGSYRPSEENDTKGYRQVLHEIALSIHQCADNESVEQWLLGHLDLLRNHWAISASESAPRPKGAIVVNSVAAARRIVQLLREQLIGISIGEITGLTDDLIRQESRDKDLIVGTSTIDVGIDFNISLLIFESFDAGSFLQRLGRLGRVHQNTPRFAAYEAHALISGKTPWISAKLAEELAQRGVANGDSFDRTTLLREAVAAAFPNASDFKNYAKRWGVLQAAHVISILEDKRREGATERLAQQLRERYAKMLGLQSLDKAMSRYWAIAPTESKKKNDLGHWQECKLLCDELLAFRGSSPFQVGVWDATTDPPAFLSYDAFALIQSATYEVIDPQMFLAAAQHQLETTQQRMLIDKLRNVMHSKQDQPLVLRVERFQPEREVLKLSMSGFDLAGNSKYIFGWRGIAIREPRTEMISEINAVLRQQHVLCYISKFDHATLRRRLKLPAFFPLYRLLDERNREFTIAFGKAALLLEAEALHLRDKDPDSAPIFC